MSELDYLYKYDPQKRAYVSRGNLGEETTAVRENRPALVLLQSENDSATGQIFPIGQEVVDVTNLHFHWQRVPVPGHHGEKVSISHFTRASTTMVMKATPVAMGNTLLVMSIRRRERNSGGSGNLNIPATPAYLIGSCGCQRTSFGVMEDCGATTPLRCWAPFFAWNSRWQAAKWQLPSRLRRREARIHSS